VQPPFSPPDAALLLSTLPVPTPPAICRMQSCTAPTDPAALDGPRGDAHSKRRCGARGSPLGSRAAGYSLGGCLGGRWTALRVNCFGAGGDGQGRPLRGVLASCSPSSRSTSLLHPPCPLCWLLLLLRRARAVRLRRPPAARAERRC
jgi:hypothetical protein